SRVSPPPLPQGPPGLRGLRPAALASEVQGPVPVLLLPWSEGPAQADRMPGALRRRRRPGATGRGAVRQDPALARDCAGPAGGLGGGVGRATGPQRCRPGPADQAPDRPGGPAPQAPGAYYAGAIDVAMLREEQDRVGHETR